MEGCILLIDTPQILRVAAQLAQAGPRPLGMLRHKLQGMPAVRFIASREEVQQGAFEYVRDELAKYRVETRGVYIKAVTLPELLVQVLTGREIANQEVETYKMQRSAQGAQVRSVGLARAEAYQRQVEALGSNATALTNAVEALSKSSVPFMPNTLVVGGSSGGGTLDGLAALLMRQVGSRLDAKPGAGTGASAP